MDRETPPQVAGETATLAAYLDFHRATLALKCSGLSDDDLRERAVPPSTLSLLGLVRHLTEVERGWFGNAVGGLGLPPLYFSDANPDGDFDDVDAAAVEESLDMWRRTVEQSREIIAGRSPDDTGTRGDGSAVTVRWVLLHVIEEYARHNGHADLLRQRIDGATGE
ncbi:DinB family protein [Nonomuraea sp. H19]|uniref:DinB family protein n=1 Tax=Nonomuraea sp. H19 TaxID=3452206 RepID=UPI003F8939D1